MTKLKYLVIFFFFLLFCWGEASPLNLKKKVGNPSSRLLTNTTEDSGIGGGLDDDELGDESDGSAEGGKRGPGDCNHLKNCALFKKLRPLIHKHAKAVREQRKQLEARITKLEMDSQNLDGISKKLTDLMTGSQKAIEAHGTKLLEHETLFKKRIQDQYNMITTKFSSNQVTLAKLASKTTKLLGQIGDQDAKLATIQEKATSFTSTITTQTKKISSLVTVRIGKMRTMLPQSASKFPEIKDMAAKIAAKMEEHSKRFGTMTTSFTSFKDKMLSSSEKMAEVKNKYTALGDKSTANEVALDGEEQRQTKMFGSLEGLAPKLADITTQGASLVTHMQEAATKVESLKTWSMSRTTKLVQQSEKISTMMSQVMSAEKTSLKHEQTLEKVKEKMAAPAEPAA